MLRSLVLLIVAASISAPASLVSTAGLVQDGSGTRLVLRTGEEPLSRAIPESDGSLRLEIQGARSALSGSHALAGNTWFSSVEASTVSRAGNDVAVFRFRPAQGRARVSVLHREWNGRDLSFLIDKTPVASPMVALWTVPVPSTAAPVLASLGTTASLEGVRAWGSGDMETVELRFSSPVPKAEISGSGKAYTISLGKARLPRLGLQASAARVLSSMAPGKEGEIRLSLKEEARSILLTRSGNDLVVRLLCSSSAGKSWAWKSGGKVETFGGVALPADEVADISDIRKSLKPSGGKEGFTVEGTKTADAKGALSSGSSTAGDKGALLEAQKLEAERRKSQEFSSRQAAESSARQDAEDKKNRVVYNTFGIRDPFIPLEADDVEGGLNIDQMRVVGIIASPTRPMAVLEHTNQPGLSVALREGDAIQNGRVLKIERDRVVFLLEEFGVSRQFALKLQAPKGEKS